MTVRIQWVKIHAKEMGKEIHEILTKIANHLSEQCLKFYLLSVQIREDMKFMYK